MTKLLAVLLFASLILVPTTAAVPAPVKPSGDAACEHASILFFPDPTSGWDCATVDTTGAYYIFYRPTLATGPYKGCTIITPPTVTFGPFTGDLFVTFNAHCGDIAGYWQAIGSDWTSQIWNQTCP